jgi:hypothetical protein
VQIPSAVGRRPFKGSVSTVVGVASVLLALRPLLSVDD